MSCVVQEYTGANLDTEMSLEVFVAFYSATLHIILFISFFCPILKGNSHRRAVECSVNSSSSNSHRRGVQL